MLEIRRFSHWITCYDFSKLWTLLAAKHDKIVTLYMQRQILEVDSIIH
jgi:hypothetical protein